MNISVLIPTYNSTKTIVYTIESVLAQTIKPFEILVVDDGSIDETLSILENYSSYNIVVFRQSNKGVANARNELFKHAKGEISGIGVDSWNVDFGLLNNAGELMGNPYHYRDKRTNDMIEEALKVIPKRELYEITGQQFLRQNTLFQLLSIKHGDSRALDGASCLLFVSALVLGFHSETV